MNETAVSIIPPRWFVDGLNAGVARDWAGEGPAPYRSALDPLVMYAWHTVRFAPPLPLVIVGGV